MKSARASRELMALLPWLVAALVWVGLVAPMRADQDLRLRDQARIRRDRVKVERKSREIQGLKERIAASLDRACRASIDPAALRQRVIASTAGLTLSPFSLSVTGGPGAVAAVEAEGSEVAVFELLRRLGDPGRGSFLRGVTIRERAGRWTAVAQTGVLDAIPAGFAPPPKECESIAPPPAETPVASPTKVLPVKARNIAKPPVAPIPVPSVEPPPPPAPPFTLVAFLVSGGRARVSLRVGDEVRVVSIGDQVGGWRCVSIDRDEGAGFVSTSGVRATLRAAASQR